MQTIRIFHPLRNLQVNVRIPHKKHSILCCASKKHWRSFEDEDPYKRSDDIVYTNEYWSTVKRLDNSWNETFSSAITDGKYLSDMIEKKWGKRYKCELSQDRRGYITFMILPFSPIEEEDEEYYKHMNELVDTLKALGAIQKIYDEITFHINTKGPTKPDWILRERTIVINTGVSASGDRKSEWHL